MNSLKRWIIDAIIGMLISFDDDIQGAASVLSGDIFSGDMYEMALSINAHIIKPITLILLSIAFLLQVVNTIMNMDIFKWETGFKVMIKYVLTYAVVNTSMTLLAAIYATTCEWTMKIGNHNGITLGGAGVNKMTDMMDSIGAFEALGLMLTIGIVMLFIKLMGVAIMVMAYARSFELLIYLSIAPLAFAFYPIEGEGTRITIRFIFNFAGVCLQSVVMLISFRLFAMLCESILYDTISNSEDITIIAFKLFMAACILAVSVMKSGSMAKSFINAA